MKKKILFVPADKYDEVVTLLTKAGIRSTSEYGIFHFDLLSFIMGAVIFVVLGIIVF